MLLSISLNEESQPLHIIIAMATGDAYSLPPSLSTCHITLSLSFIGCSLAGLTSVSLDLSYLMAPDGRKLALTLT